MRFFKLLSIYVVALQFVIQPVAFSAPPTKKIKRVPASESIQAKNVSEKVEALFGLKKNEGWGFMNSDGQEVSLATLLASNEKEFKMLSPVDTSGNQYGIRFKLVESDDLVIAIAVYDKEFTSALSRRLIKLDTSKPASDSLISIEQTLNAMEQELLQKTKRQSSFFKNLIIGDVHAAKMPPAFRRLLKVAFWASAGIFAGPILLQMSVQPKSKKAGNIIMGIWLGALALAGLALTIDYVVNEEFPWD